MTQSVTITPILDVRNLTVDFRNGDEWTTVIENVSLSVNPGEIVGLVGESGSGKTVTALALMRLLASNSRISSGSIVCAGKNILEMSEAEVAEVRGNDIAMVFQEPMRSLNPGFTVGEQIAEAIRRHRAGCTRTQAWERAVEMLELVEIPDPDKRARSYPHELSGGMCQRVMIAMALACDPKVLVADEPTTALDVTVQAQILRLLLSLRDRIGISIVLITHDLGIVAETCDRTMVMYAGQIVELSDTASLFATPGHPYSAGLMAAIPNLMNREQRLTSIPGRVPPPGSWPVGCRFEKRCTHAVEGLCTSAAVDLSEVSAGRSVRCVRAAGLELAGVSSDNVYSGTGSAQRIKPVVAESTVAPLMTARDISKSFVMKKNLLGKVVSSHQAVRQVSVDVHPGETLVIVGESGAGKSTLGRMLLRLDDPDTGTITFDGKDISAMSTGKLRSWRKSAQMIFQDPFNSLDPRVSILDSLTEPMRVHGLLDGNGRRERALDLLERVGISRDQSGRFPYEFSGGQLQRIAIARALTTDPKLIVCDEPVAALDMSIRAQVINLLRDIQEELGIAYVFITHDLSLVRVIANRVVVMYKGRIMEVADGTDIFTTARHPYTRRLLEAVPIPDPRQRRLVGLEPMAVNERFPVQVVQGCAYARYCSSVQDICGERAPEPFVRGANSVACHFPIEEDSMVGSVLMSG